MSHHRRTPSSSVGASSRGRGELSALLETLHMPDTSSNERMYALVQLEHIVSQRVLHDLPHVKQRAQENGTRRAMFFIQLERCCDWSAYHHGVKTHLAEHLLDLLGRLHLTLQGTYALEEGHSIASEMGCTMSILQGMCLTNDASRQLCSSKSSLALLLAIAKAEYCRQQPDSTALGLLVPHTLDTLMCILVDAPSDVRRSFEQAHGLSIVRRIMNTHKSAPPTSHTTHAKCIEFLLFYLQAKEFEQQAAQQLTGNVAPSVFQPPEAPTPKPKRGHARSRSAITATPFYSPAATPLSRHRVMSYGSPTKHVSKGVPTMLPESNPFLLAKSRDAPHDPTTRTAPRPIEPEALPVRRDIGPP